MVQTNRVNSALWGSTYFVFTQKWKMEDDLQGLSIGGHHDELADSPVESFCGFVGTLLQLLNAGALFDYSHDFGGEFVIGKWGSSLSWVLRN